MTCGLTVTFNGTIPDCVNNPIGNLSVIVSGGSGNYGYTWLLYPTQTSSPIPVGPSNSSLTSIAYIPGFFHRLTVEDLTTGCFSDSVFASFDPCDCSGPSVDLNIIQDPRCNVTGQLSIDISSGTPPYNIRWTNITNPSGVINSNIVSPYDSGDIYLYVITDDNQCAASGGVIGPSGDCPCEVTLTSKTAEVTCNP